MWIGSAAFSNVLSSKDTVVEKCPFYEIVPLADTAGEEPIFVKHDGGSQLRGAVKK